MYLEFGPYPEEFPSFYQQLMLFLLQLNLWIVNKSYLLFYSKHSKLSKKIISDSYSKFKIKKIHHCVNELYLKLIVNSFKMLLDK